MVLESRILITAADAVSNLDVDNIATPQEMFINVMQARMIDVPEGTVTQFALDNWQAIEVLIALMRNDSTEEDEIAARKVSEIIAGWW